MNTSPSSAVSPSDAADLQALREIPTLYTRLRQELGKRIVGQDDTIRDLFVALMAQGHCLMVGVPGLAKTLLIKSLAEASDLTFRRIQFTPDLMPSDVTGSEILEEAADGRRTFRFTSGPVFTQLLLADEINRAPAKTQSALLEAMEERRVTTAGISRDLPRPFFVLATQNPIEQEGTYPLPEAELDRFIFCLHLGYPSASEEAKILQTTTGAPSAPLDKVCTAQTLQAMQQMVRQVHVPASVADFAVSLVQATRPETDSAPAIVKRCVRWGAGPRATQSLALAAKVAAALDGRFNCCVDDIVSAAKVVLRHRLVLNYRAEADQLDADKLIDELVQGMKR
jgi:MoxR-like ATPase